jgi:hypothetical protein
VLTHISHCQNPKLSGRKDMIEPWKIPNYQAF